MRSRSSRGSARGARIRFARDERRGATRPGRDRDHHARMGADRLHRLRRPAGAHRAAARALRRAPPLAGRAHVRGRDRGLQPAAGPGVDAARDPLRVALRGSAGALVGGLGSSCPRAAGDARARRGLPRRAPPAASGAPAPARAPPSPRWRRRPASRLLVPELRRAAGAPRRRRIAYVAAGAVAAATVGPWLVLVLLACGRARARPAAQGRRPPASTRGRCSPPCRAAACGSPGPRSRSARSPTAAASSSSR